MFLRKRGVGYYPVVDPETCKVIDCDLWSNITNLACWGGNSITGAGTGKCSGAVVPPSAQPQNAPTDQNGNPVVPTDTNGDPISGTPGTCGVMDLINGSVANGSCAMTAGGLISMLAIGSAVFFGGVILLEAFVGGRR